MKCEFCSEEDASFKSLPDDRQVRTCERCAPLCSLVLVVENNRLNAREVMIAQHQRESRRKLLELKNHFVTAFFSESLAVVTLEIESRRDKRVVRWYQSGTMKEYAVENIGRSYANRDEMIPSVGFDAQSFKTDLELSRENLQPRLIVAAEACLGKLEAVYSK
jgi:hypothetical protein